MVNRMVDALWALNYGEMKKPAGLRDRPAFCHELALGGSHDERARHTRFFVAGNGAVEFIAARFERSEP